MTICQLASVPSMSFLTAATLVYANGTGITTAAGTRLALKFGYERLRGPIPSICHGHGYDRLRGGDFILNTYIFPPKSKCESQSLAHRGGGYVTHAHNPHPTSMGNSGCIM